MRDEKCFLPREFPVVRRRVQALAAVEHLDVLDQCLGWLRNVTWSQPSPLSAAQNFSATALPQQ